MRVHAKLRVPAAPRLGDPLGLIEHEGLHAPPLQSMSDGEPANAGADDDVMQFVSSVGIYRQLLQRNGCKQ